MLGFSGGVLSIAPVGLNAMLTDYIKPVQKLFVGLSDYGFQIPPALAEMADTGQVSAAYSWRGVLGGRHRRDRNRLPDVRHGRPSWPATSGTQAGSSAVLSTRCRVPSPQTMTPRVGRSGLSPSRTARSGEFSFGMVFARL